MIHCDISQFINLIKGKTKTKKQEKQNKTKKKLMKDYINKQIEQVAFYYINEK